MCDPRVLGESNQEDGLWDQMQTLPCNFVASYPRPLISRFRVASSYTHVECVTLIECVCWHQKILSREKAGRIRAEPRDPQEPESKHPELTQVQEESQGGR